MPRIWAAWLVVTQYDSGSCRWLRHWYDLSAIASASPGVTGRPWNRRRACSGLHPSTCTGSKALFAGGAAAGNGGGAAAVAGHRCLLRRRSTTEHLPLVDRLSTIGYGSGHPPGGGVPYLYRGDPRPRRTTDQFHVVCVTRHRSPGAPEDGSHLPAWEQPIPKLAKTALLILQRPEMPRATDAPAVSVPRRRAVWG
jgi:hypothetical protein